MISENFCRIYHICSVFSGVSVQTETVLRQALCENIKPVLMMNKLDRTIFEKALTPEEIYCTLRSVIENVNALIGIYCDAESIMGDVMVCISMKYFLWVFFLSLRSIYVTLIFLSLCLPR